LLMNKVFICTSKINTASQRIATKHGFQQEGILREEFKSGDEMLEDIVYFGLLKSDYER
jgi:ribosomal-protein-serine acetyltransferase